MKKILAFIIGVLMIFITVHSQIQNGIEKLSKNEGGYNKMVPTEIILGLPEYLSPQISPDGKKIAYLKKENNVLNIYVLDEHSKEKKITSEEKRSILYFEWSYNNEDILFMKDSDGDENWHIYKVNIYTNKLTDLTPFENVKARILKSSPLKPDEIVIEMNKQNPQLFDVYKLNLKNGNLEILAKNDGNVISGIGEGMHGWMIDNNLEVRGAHFVLENGDIELRYLENGRWYPVITFPAEESLFCSGQYVLNPYEFYIHDSYNSPTYGISLINVKTKERKKIFYDPHFDVDWFIFDNYTNEMLAISIYNEKGRQWVALSDKVKKDIEFLNNNFDSYYRIISGDLHNENWIIEYSDYKTPIEYYLYLSKNKELKFLFSSRPDLKDYKLPEKEYRWIETRDGYKMVIYLTFPEGVERKSLPTVVLVHGGPWGRDSMVFDPLSSWLATRGYLCLQVNFRGSVGFGKEFVNAADREWGGKMHNDVMDAIDWGIKKGVIDPQRIAIMGASYGGYETLVAVTFNPELFKCGISICGISNLITSLNSIPPAWKTYWKILTMKIGDPEKDKDLLISRSPYFFADNIKVPLLIAQGANDPRVKKEESEQIVKVLKEKGKEAEYLLFEDEGHSIVKQENRLVLYKKIEEFLNKNLK